MDPTWAGLIIRAPRRNGDAQGGIHRVQTVTLVANTASAAVDMFSGVGGLPPHDNQQSVEGLYARFNYAADFAIAFGRSDVAAPTLAADWPVWSRSPEPFWADSIETRFFRVISATAGTLFWYFG